MTLIETLRAWAEAFEDATIRKMDVETVTLVNGGAVTDDMRLAADRLEALGDTVCDIVAKAKMQEWQPIETAPLDGTEVDLWCSDKNHPKGYRVADCHFLKTEWLKWTPEYGHEKIINPTHWMPLPEPPNA